MGSNVSYLAYLNWVLTLGTKLPQALQLFEQLVSVVQQLYSLVAGTPVSQQLAAVEVTDEHLALEAQVGELLTPAGSQAVFDGSRLRSAWKFLTDSGLLPVIISLLTKSVTA